MPSGISVKITGTREAMAALDRLMVFMSDAAQQSVEECADMTKDEAVRSMGPTHPRGTPGAPAGAPPWRISRRLSMSITASRAYLSGADAYSAYVGPMSPPVYGRVQELGRAGGRRYPNTHVNPHPYLKPARDRLLFSGEFTKVHRYNAEFAERDALH